MTVNDARWDDHRIDFARIVKTTIDMAAHNPTLGVAAEYWQKHPLRAVCFCRPFHDMSREVNIVLTNDSELRKLNKKYRGKDAPTNVLSFETGDSELLGDIFISFDTVMQESEDKSSKFTAHATHMVVHGVLHLLGYDHLNDKDAAVMEQCEGQIMQKLGLQNPCKGNEDYNGHVIISKFKFRVPLFLVMLMAGVAASFGFAPYYCGIATVAGFIALYVASYNRDGFWRGYMPGFWFGTGYGTSMFYWMLNSIFADPIIAQQMRVWFMPGLIGIALVSGIVFGFPVALTSWICARTKIRSIVSNNGGWRRPIIFAGIWTLVLWLREWFLTGFPWNPLANISMPFPWLSNSMSLWGALGLTFIIVGFIASIAQELTPHISSAASDKRNTGHRWAFLIFIPLIIIGIAAGKMNIDSANRSWDPGPQSLTFRIVQPALNQSVKMSRFEAEENLNRLVALSKGGSPDIVVWPETAYPFLIPVEDGDFSNIDFALAREIGATVIFGVMTASGLYSLQPGGVQFYNSMAMAGADGRILSVYDKAHLVPFGEYRPFGDIIPTPGQLTPGRGAALISVANVTEIKDGDSPRAKGKDWIFAPAICYEIIFSDSLVPHGTKPDVIVNITNDTWFGESSGPHQHLDMARRYAIESGLPIVRANYSGISAFIGADGRMISQLPLGAEGVLDGTVGGAHMTVYRIIGRNWTMIIILAFAVIIALVPIPVRRKKG